MTEEAKDEESLNPEQTEPDILFLIKRMNQKLDFLERKIDILVKQAQERPSREKYSSRPPRSFDRPARPGGNFRDKRGPGEDSRERGSYSGYNSERRPRDEKKGFDGPKRSYSDDRGNKKYGDKTRVFSPKKKFFSKTKKR